MAILVTGGAGYIGSHAVAELLARNEEVVVVDNLQQGHREAVLGGKLYEGDIRDAAFMDTVFQDNQIEAIIHFAAHSLVGESMQNPAKYYQNNVFGTLCLLEKMNEYGVKKSSFPRLRQPTGSRKMYLSSKATVPFRRMRTVRRSWLWKK